MIDYTHLSVIDTETTKNIPLEAEVAQLAVGTWVDGELVIESKFFDTVTPMPFTAMAVNHITREMISGLPLFLQDKLDDLTMLRYASTRFYIAHNSNYDSKVIKKRCNEVEFEFTTPFICTMRLSEKIFGSEIELKNLSYLRYRLALPVRTDIGLTHRADTDVEITGLLYQKLVNEAIQRKLIDPSLDIHSQMFEMCWKAKPLATFPIGKHKGKTFNEIPTDYYLWLIDNSDKLKENSEFYDQDFAAAVETELLSRLEPEPSKV